MKLSKEKLSGSELQIVPTSLPVYY